MLGTSYKETPNSLLQKLNAFVPASDGSGSLLAFVSGHWAQPYGSWAFNNLCIRGKARWPYKYVMDRLTQISAMPMWPKQMCSGLCLVCPNCESGWYMGIGVEVLFCQSNPGSSTIDCVLFNPSCAWMVVGVGRMMNGTVFFSFSRFCSIGVNFWLRGLWDTWLLSFGLWPLTFSQSLTLPSFQFP